MSKSTPDPIDVDELQRFIVRAMDEMHLARDVVEAAKAYVEEWPPKVSEAHTKLTEALARWEAR